MSKALIEKAFEKFMLDKFGIEAKNIDIKAWNIYKDNFDYAWQAGATWQREQLCKELRKIVCKDCEYNDDKRTCDTDPQLSDYCYRYEIIAKLDLLEGEKTNE